VIFSFGNMTLKEFKKILKKYKDGLGTKAENELVNGWFDNLSARQQSLFADEEAEVKFQNKMKKVIGFEDSDDTNRVNWRLAVACAVMALLTWGGFYLADFKKEKFIATSEASPNRLHNEFVNNSSKERIYRLEDGSMVTLYPKSKLSNLSFSRSERWMALEGTAFFKVAVDPDRPFIIAAKHLTARVLGTSFLIDAEKGKEESVEVKSGQVAVYRNAGKNKAAQVDSYISLTPNFQVRFDTMSHKFIKSIVTHPTRISFAEQASEADAGGTDKEASSFETNFEDKSAAEILDAIAVLYGVPIKFDHKVLSGCRLTINVKNEDLYAVLQAVCDLTGGVYRVDGIKIFLESNGCGGQVRN